MLKNGNRNRPVGQDTIERDMCGPWRKAGANSAASTRRRSSNEKSQSSNSWCETSRIVKKVARNSQAQSASSSSSTLKNDSNVLTESQNVRIDPNIKQGNDSDSTQRLAQTSQEKQRSDHSSRAVIRPSNQSTVNLNAETSVEAASRRAEPIRSYAEVAQTKSAKRDLFVKASNQKETTVPSTVVQDSSRFRNVSPKKAFCKTAKISADHRFVAKSMQLRESNNEATEREQPSFSVGEFPQQIEYCLGQVPKRQGLKLYDFASSAFSRPLQVNHTFPRRNEPFSEEHEIRLTRLRLAGPTAEEEHYRGLQIVRLHEECENICSQDLGFPLPKDLLDQCIFVGTGLRKWFNFENDTVNAGRAAAKQQSDLIKQQYLGKEKKSHGSNLTLDQWQDPIFPDEGNEAYKRVIMRELSGDAIGRPIPADKRSMPQKVIPILSSALGRSSYWLARFCREAETEKLLQFLEANPIPGRVVLGIDIEHVASENLAYRYSTECCGWLFDSNSNHGTQACVQKANISEKGRSSATKALVVPEAMPLSWRDWIDRSRATVQIATFIDGRCMFQDTFFVLSRFLNRMNTPYSKNTSSNGLSAVETVFLLRAEELMRNLLVAMLPCVAFFVDMTANKILDAMRSYRTRMFEFVLSYDSKAHRSSCTIEIKDCTAETHNAQSIPSWNQEVEVRFLNDKLRCRKAHFEKYRRLFDLNRLTDKDINQVENGSSAIKRRRISLDSELDQKPKSLSIKEGESRCRKASHKASQSKDVIPSCASFNEALYVMLKRYDNVIYSPKHHTCGGNMHAAAPEKVFHFLKESFNLTFECFASPNNCFFSRYCSAFPDSDAPFGSLGSFFDLPTFPAGAYEVGPPYTEEMLLFSIDHIESIMKKVPDHHALTFILFVPDWSDCIGVQRMKSSPWCTADIEGPGGNHVYVIGTQHMVAPTRLARYYQPPHATKCFILQNAGGKKQQQITSDIERSLRARMQDRLSCPSASAATRQINLQRLAHARLEQLDEKRNKSPEAWWDYITYGHVILKDVIRSGAKVSQNNGHEHQDVRWKTTDSAFGSKARRNLANASRTTPGETSGLNKFLHGHEESSWRRTPPLVASTKISIAESSDLSSISAKIPYTQNYRPISSAQESITDLTQSQETGSNVAQDFRPQSWSASPEPSAVPGPPSLTPKENTLAYQQISATQLTDDKPMSKLLQPFSAVSSPPKTSAGTSLAQQLAGTSDDDKSPKAWEEMRADEASQVPFSNTNLECVANNSICNHYQKHSYELHESQCQTNIDRLDATSNFQQMQYNQNTSQWQLPYEEGYQHAAASSWIRPYFTLPAPPAVRYNAVEGFNKQLKLQSSKQMYSSAQNPQQLSFPHSPQFAAHTEALYPIRCDSKAALRQQPQVHIALSSDNFPVKLSPQSSEECLPPPTVVPIPEREKPKSSSAPDIWRQQQTDEEVFCSREQSLKDVTSITTENSQATSMPEGVYSASERPLKQKSPSGECNVSSTEEISPPFANMSFESPMSQPRRSRYDNYVESHSPCAHSAGYLIDSHCMPQFEGYSQTLGAPQAEEFLNQFPGQVWVLPPPEMNYNSQYYITPWCDYSRSQPEMTYAAMSQSPPQNGWSAANNNADWYVNNSTPQVLPQRKPPS